MNGRGGLNNPWDDGGRSGVGGGVSGSRRWVSAGGIRVETNEPPALRYRWGVARFFVGLRIEAAAMVSRRTATREAFDELTSPRRQCDGTRPASSFETGAARRALLQVTGDIFRGHVGIDAVGYALICQVRALLPEEGGAVPALALTAYAHREDQRSALSAGFQLTLTTRNHTRESMLGSFESGGRDSRRQQSTSFGTKIWETTLSATRTVDTPSRSPADVSSWKIPRAASVAPPAIVAAALLLAGPGTAAAARPRVLRVCNGSTTPCPRGTRYASVSAAVARVQRYRPRRGRQYWILVWPGVYHEKGSAEAGVLVTTPNVHIRGMDRNLVIIDGTNGSPGAPCPPDANLQDLAGRNGIEVFKADGGSVENLTVCNYLEGPSGGGNEIWWNGGDGSGAIGLGTYDGNYLTATSTFYGGTDQPLAQYGIFVSNANGPNAGNKVATLGFTVANVEVSVGPPGPLTA